jgi:hypothetical protein
MERELVIADLGRFVALNSDLCIWPPAAMLGVQPPALRKTSVGQFACATEFSLAPILVEASKDASL